LNDELKQEALVEVLIDEAVKTSEIEGVMILLTILDYMQLT